MSAKSGKGVVMYMYKKAIIALRCIKTKVINGNRELQEMLGSWWNYNTRGCP